MLHRPKFPLAAVFAAITLFSNPFPFVATARPFRLANAGRSACGKGDLLLRFENVHHDQHRGPAKQFGCRGKPWLLGQVKTRRQHRAQCP